MLIFLLVFDVNFVETQMRVSVLHYDFPLLSNVFLCFDTLLDFYLVLTILLLLIHSLFLSKHGNVFFENKLKKRVDKHKRRVNIATAKRTSLKI